MGRSEGRITNWKDDQGFGFITPSGGGERVFVHVKAFSNRKRRPAGNEIVTYEPATDQRGRARAENVVFVDDRSSFPFGKRSFFVTFAVVFVSVVAASAYAGKVPAVVLGLYVGASVVAFSVYALDKLAALKGRWRTPENTLHMLGLVGGWPGALAAQGLLRHKSTKQPFQVIFWGTVLLNCGGLVWLLSPQGSGALRAIVKATGWLCAAWR